MKVDAVTARYPQQNFKGLFRKVEEVKEDEWEITFEVRDN